MYLFFIKTLISRLYVRVNCILDYENIYNWDNTRACMAASFYLDGRFEPLRYLTPVTFCSACTKTGQWVIMYLSVRGIDWPFSVIFLLEFGNVPTVWYFLVFIIFYVIQAIFKLQNVPKTLSKEMFQSLCPFCPRRNENYSVNKLLFISLRQMTWLNWCKLKESLQVLEEIFLQVFFYWTRWHPYY